MSTFSNAASSSLYFEYPNYESHRPVELDGSSPVHPVAVVGAGPVGMALALALANRGVECVVLERQSTVGYGSRAGSISRRSVEFLDSIGVADDLLQLGYTYSGGWTYFRDREIYRLEMPGNVHDRHPPMLKLQQCYVEQVLADHSMEHPLIDMRWGSAVAGVTATDNEVRVNVESAHGGYGLHARYIVGADGARSTVRGLLGDQLEGETYPATFVIADVQMKVDQLVGRRVWFDPPWNPGGTVIMHLQPMDIWRFDYSIPQGSSPEEESQESTLRGRIQAHLDWIGWDSPWELDWSTVYRAHGRLVRHFRHGRVLLAGDAAHLVPIFGVRGLNGGLADAANLEWKLARVLAGRSPDYLLDSYDIEARAAAMGNIAEADKSARFMCPDSPGGHVLREVVLRLAIEHDFVRPLVDPRQSSPVSLPDSPLVTPTGGLGTVARPGDPLPNLALPPVDGGAPFLHDTLGADFTIVTVKSGEEFSTVVTEVAVGDEAVRQVIISVDEMRDEQLWQLRGRTFLVRPDTFIAAAWRNRDDFDVASALDRSLGRAPGIEKEPMSDDLPIETRYLDLTRLLVDLEDDEVMRFFATWALLLAEAVPDAATVRALAQNAHTVCRRDYGSANADTERGSAQT